jgi:hypothetical protein
MLCVPRLQKLALDDVSPVKAYFTSNDLELIIGFEWTVNNNGNKTFGPMFSIATPFGKPDYVRQVQDDSPKGKTVFMQNFRFVEYEDEMNLHSTVEIAGVRFYVGS